MAKLRFIRGTITGKLGEFVGSTWKGINYIKTFTKPSNPRTAGQMNVRVVFKKLSQFATALYKAGIFAFFPSAAKMTERNSVFKANRAMLTNKAFVAANLQVAAANFAIGLSAFTCAFASTVFTLNCTVQKTGTGSTLSNTLIHVLVFDTVQGISAGYGTFTPSFNTMGQYKLVSEEIDGPVALTKADCRAYVWVTAVDEDGKKLISSTLSIAVS